MTYRLILRSEVLAQHRTTRGLDKDQDLAAAMNVSGATVSRVLNGKAEPGPTFIAGLVAAFPDVSLDDLLGVA